MDFIKLIYGIFVSAVSLILSAGAVNLSLKIFEKR